MFWMLTQAQVALAAEFVKRRVPASPSIGIVLGSGLMHLTRLLSDSVCVRYSAIPMFPISRVTGHDGVLHAGTLANKAVVCLAGRVHGYEGHAPDRITFGVRVLAQLGCHTVILTNAAGAISTRLGPGSLMLIEDHLNLTGANPLVGWHAHGAEFINMSNAYDPDLRERAMRCASALSIDLSSGVYAGLLGPSYETPAEIRMLARLGADAGGMSTVHETIALRDVGVRVVGISCITNMAAGIKGSILDHAHVQEVANASRHQLESLVTNLVEQLPDPSAR